MITVKITEHDQEQKPDETKTQKRLEQVEKDVRILKDMIRNNAEILNK